MGTASGDAPGGTGEVGEAVKPFKLTDGQHELTGRELDEFTASTYSHEHDAAVYGANARSLASEVLRLRARVEALEAALANLFDDDSASAWDAARAALEGKS